MDANAEKGFLFFFFLIMLTISIVQFDQGEYFYSLIAIGLSINVLGMLLERGSSSVKKQRIARGIKLSSTIPILLSGVFLLLK